MNEESLVKSRVNSQLKRSNGILTEQDLKNLNSPIEIC